MELCVLNSMQNFSRLVSSKFSKSSNCLPLRESEDIRNNESIYDYSKFIYSRAINHGIIICKTCNNEFSQSANNHLRGKGCPFCKNKTESIFIETLKILYPKIEYQFKKDWCKSKRPLPFDFLLEQLNIIIELDGRQHFRQVLNWESPEEQNKRDLYKMKCANQNGYSMIRILQEDVFYNKYDWLTELKESIEKIKNDKKELFHPL